MHSLNNHNFKPDADKITVLYCGDYDNYCNILYDRYDTKAAMAFRGIDCCVMNFRSFVMGVAKVKQREYRDAKIDSIIS